MKKIPKLPWFILAIVCVMSPSSYAQTQTKAVRKWVGPSFIVDIELSDKDRPRSVPIGSLVAIKDGITKVVADVPALIPSPFQRFTIAMPPPPSPLTFDADAAYEVTLIFDAVDEKGIPFRRSLTVPVKGEQHAELQRLKVSCNSDNAIRLRTTFSAPLAGSPALIKIKTWLAHHKKDWKSIATVTIKPKGGNEIRYDITHLSDPDVTGRVLTMCAELGKRLPNDEFTATVVFNTAATDSSGTLVFPSVVPEKIKAEGLAGTSAIDFPENADKDSPEKWKLERSLDFGVSATSSVTDEEISPATSTSPAVQQRQRQNIGVFDLALQSNDLIKQVQRINKNVWFLSLFVKAAVSTAKIDKDTLSQNRILFGITGETRYRFLKDGRPPSFHRFEWGVTHASDRDFKQKEIYASFVYRPVFDALYRPYELNGRRVGQGDDEHIEPRNYGFKVEPFVGFDFGRTYSRRNPAPAVETSDVIRRLNAGLSIGVDITKFISLTAENTFYVRWEDPLHKQRNFFKAQGEFKLFRSSRERAAHSLFVTFEKGWAPPFTGQQVNAVKAGYRVVGNFCGLYCR